MRFTHVVACNNNKFILDVSCVNIPQFIHPLLFMDILVVFRSKVLQIISMKFLVHVFGEFAYAVLLGVVFMNLLVKQYVQGRLGCKS